LNDLVDIEIFLMRVPGFVGVNGFDLERDLLTEAL
jgi:hypothetical protein